MLMHDPGIASTLDMRPPPNRARSLGCSLLARPVDFPQFGAPHWTASRICPASKRNDTATHVRAHIAWTTSTRGMVQHRRVSCLCRSVEVSVEGSVSLSCPCYDERKRCVTSVTSTIAHTCVQRLSTAILDSLLEALRVAATNTEMSLVGNRESQTSERQAVISSTLREALSVIGGQAVPRVSASYPTPPSPRKLPSFGAPTKGRRDPFVIVGVHVGSHGRARSVFSARVPLVLSSIFDRRPRKS